MTHDNLNTLLTMLKYDRWERDANLWQPCRNYGSIREQVKAHVDHWEEQGLSELSHLRTQYDIV